MPIAQTLRGLVRRPAYSTAVVATFALAIGGATTVSSLVDAALLRPLSVPDPHGLVAIAQATPRGPVTTSYSHPAFREFRREAAPLVDLAAHAATRIVLQVGDRIERVQAEIVSANYFGVMRLVPAAGRFFLPGEDASLGSGPVCLLSERYWRARLGADPGVLGTTVIANRVPLTAVGVVPSPFQGSVRGDDADVWIPLSMYPAVRFGGVTRLFGRMEPAAIFDDADWHWMDLIGRLAPGVTPVQATTAIRSAVPRMPSLAQGGRTEWPVAVESVPRGLGSRTVALEKPLAAVAAAVALLLLIACANIASLMLTRESSRARDHAIRLSLGASRLGLAGSLLAEHAVLAAAGGTMGLACASWLVALVPALQPGTADTIRLAARVDTRVAALALALVAVTALLSGLLPALRAAHGAAAPALHRGGAFSGRARHGTRLRRVLVVAQVAVSLVLLVGAAMLGRTLLSLTSVPLGFDTTHRLAATLNLGGHVGTAEAGTAFTRLLLERIRAVPGVEAVSLANSVPIDRRNSSLGGFVPDGMANVPERGVQLTLNVVTSGYFDAMGIPLLRGRVFTHGDPPGTAAGIVLNESAAREFFPGRDAVGQRLQRKAVAGREAQAIEVIGIVADSRFENLDRPVRPLAYFHAIHPVMGQVMPEQWIVVKTAGDPMSRLSELQAAVRSVDRHMALLEPVRMRDRVAQAVSLQRILAAVVAFFGIAALVLAAVGLYGVLAQTVFERTREIGVRVALGAQRRQIVLMIARSAGLLVAVGIAAGSAAAALSGRFLASLLFGVTPGDPLAFASAAAVLAAVGAAATAVPARRAASVDPSVSLRAE